MYYVSSRIWDRLLLRWEVVADWRAFQRTDTPNAAQAQDERELGTQYESRTCTVRTGTHVRVRNHKSQARLKICDYFDYSDDAASVVYTRDWDDQRDRTLCLTIVIMSHQNEGWYGSKEE